jgi:archaellum component FlaC
MNYHNNMKPTTEQILSALNKLVRENKTELKAEKVELGLEAEAKSVNKLAVETLDELDQIENRFQNSEKEYLKIRKDFISQDSKTLAQVKKIEKVVTKLEAVKSNYDKAAKELGVDVDNIKVYQELSSNLRYAKGYAKSGLEQSKEIRKYIK